MRSDRYQILFTHVENGIASLHQSTDLYRLKTRYWWEYLFPSVESAMRVRHISIHGNEIRSISVYTEIRSVWSPGLATPAPWWYLDARKFLTISYIRPIANTYSQLSKALLYNSQQTSSGWKPVSDGNTYCLQEKCTNEGATNQFIQKCAQSGPQGLPHQPPGGI